MNLNQAATRLNEQNRRKAEHWLRPRVGKALAKIEKRINKGKDAKASLVIPYSIKRLQSFGSGWSFTRITRDILKEHGVSANIIPFENGAGIELIITLTLSTSL